MTEQPPSIPGVWFCEQCRVLMLQTEAAKNECVHRPAERECPLSARVGLNHVLT
jgi:hypothetical protein